MNFRFCKLIALSAVALLCSCLGPGDPAPMSAYQPVLMSRTQLEASVQFKGPQQISEPGKIYHYGNLIFINELYKGIHVINNQDPASPVKVGFVQVPGNVDFAVKEDVLYVDSAVDLVALDFSDINNVAVTKRIRNSFPPLMAPDNMPYNTDWAGAPEDAVIVGWELIGEL